MNKILSILLVASLISGCASSEVGYTDDAKFTPPTDLSIKPEVNSYTSTLTYRESTTLLSVFFNKNSSALLPTSNNALTLVSKFLQDNPTALIQLQGNTSDSGTEKYNNELGLLRANTVKNKLITLGVNPTSISVVTFGYNKPAFNIEPENRRVDIVFTSSVAPTGYKLIKNKIPGIVIEIPTLSVINEE